MNTKGRLFTFGCSLTRYHYPTWADILGQQWNFFENWGEPGSGNHAIFNAIVECDARNRFNHDDTVIVLWSALARLDVYQKFKWKHTNNLFIDDDDNVCCPDGYEIHSYAYFSAIENFLKHRKCHYVPMTWTKYFPDSKVGKIYRDTLRNIKFVKIEFNKKKYKKKISSDQFEKYFLDLYNTLQGKDWPSLDNIKNRNFQDCPPQIKKEIEHFLHLVDNDPRYKISDEVDKHPTPLQYLTIIDNYFTDITISDDVRIWVKNMDRNLLQGEKIEFPLNLPKEKF